MTTSIDKQAKLPDITLSYREWPGEQGPILCLPSFAAHKGSFDRIAAALSPQYHVIAMDLRGRGDSSKPSEGYGFAYHVHDILQLMEHLEIKTFSIIGHSFGATVGTYLASIRPEKVASIVMLEGGADPTAAVLEAIRPSLEGLESSYESMEQYLAAMRQLPFYNAPWSKALENYLKDDIKVLPNGKIIPKATSIGLHRDLDLHFQYSMCLHFPSISCPALFVRAGEGLLGGDKGHIFSDPETNAIVKWIPNGQRADVAGVNHFTMVLHDQPPVIAPIKEFLTKVLPSTR